VSGIGTFANELNVGLDGTVLTVLGIGNSIGVGTALPAFLLDVRSPVSTGQTALYVQGDVRITGDLVVEDDLVLDEVTTRNITVSNQATTLNLSATGIGTITTLNSTSGTITNLTGTSGTITTLNSTSGTITNLTGTSGTITTFNSTNGTITNLTGTAATIGTVQISSGIITASSGVVTYYGDGQYLDLTNNPSTGIGIGTIGGLVGYGITFLDLKGAGVSTTQYNSNTGIATIFFEGGGGGGGSISISTTAPASPDSGDLWYSPDYGRTFIYYDESTVGYGTDAFWIDAAPFNVGIITSLTNVSFSPGSATSPSMFFIGDNQTGFFSPGTGQFTVVSSGSSVLNINPSGINVTGITTITNAAGTVKIGIGTTALLVEGNARVTGILTVGSSSITLNGITDTINVGTGLTLSSSGIVAGVITATSFVGSISGTATSTTNIPNLSGDITSVNTVTTLATVNANVGTFGNGTAIPSITVNAKGLITGVTTTAVSSGTAITDDTSTNASRFLTFTSATSGSISAANVSSTKLTFNPSTGLLTVVDINSTSDLNLKENIKTIENSLNTLSQLRGVSFDWKETGRSSYGVIAQELEEILPDLVKNGEVKSVNYNGLIGVLIEAVKELSEEVKELKRTK
jgi:hypothetical protein